MKKTLKSVNFSPTCFTFWAIAQLTDVQTFQDRLEIEAETKTFPTHTVSPRKMNITVIRSGCVGAEGADGTAKFPILRPNF